MNKLNKVLSSEMNEINSNTLINENISNELFHLLLKELQQKNQIHNDQEHYKMRRMNNQTYTQSTFSNST